MLFDAWAVWGMGVGGGWGLGVVGVGVRLGGWDGGWVGGRGCGCGGGVWGVGLGSGCTPTNRHTGGGGGGGCRSIGCRFYSQNAIEASDSPLPGGLWVKRLITHVLCSLAYSDIAWCKLFLILTMKCLYWVFFAYKTPYSVLIDNSIHIQEIDTEITRLTLQGQFLDASNIYQFHN